MFRTRRARRLGVFVVALLASTQASCFGGDERPTRLIDGSAARAPAVTLEGVDSPQIVTTATAIDPRKVSGGPVARCLATTREHETRAPVILHVGVDGASITFRTASGRYVVACDGVRAGSQTGVRWCGRALGRMHGGRLLDPRLDLADCSSPSGDPVAFAWVAPGPHARYVAVRRRGFVEVNRVVAGLPVRVTTTSDIELDTASASFAVSEHSAAGRKLRSYTVQARVAG